MKYSKSNFCFFITIIAFLFLIPLQGFSQKRIKPPKRSSKVKSVDQFVNHTFELYHKIFVYDSLDRAGVEVPVEVEDALVKSIEKDLDSLWGVIPDIIDDIGDASLFRQAKATLNLNKSKKALTYCIITVKNYLVGTKEEEDD